MCVVSLISLGLSAYFAYAGVKAQNKAADYNAEIQQRNAQIAGMQAKEAGKRGELEQKQLRLNIAKTRGAQRAAFGASGVLVDEGSALDVLEDTNYLGEQDSLTLKHNTAMEVWGIKNQAAGFESKAGLLKSQKKSAVIAGGTTLLTGTGSLLASQKRTSVKPTTKI